MRIVAGERIERVHKVRRKGRPNGVQQTKCEIGFGYIVDESGKATGEVVLRTNQIGSDVAPIVAVVDIQTSEMLLEDLAVVTIKAMGEAGVDTLLGSDPVETG